MKRLTEIRSGTPCIVLQQNTTDTWMLTEGKWKGSQAKFLYGEHAKVLSDVQDILRDDYDLDRLRELVKADREGRCVVLPCKVGDKVFQQNGVDIFESQVKKIIYDCGHFAFDEETIGERVFLTRESAEAALKGEQA